VVLMVLLICEAEAIKFLRGFLKNYQQATGHLFSFTACRKNTQIQRGFLINYHQAVKWLQFGRKDTQFGWDCLIEPHQAAECLKFDKGNRKTVEDEQIWG